MNKNNQITSMTGFGSGAAEGQGLRLGVELRSVNSRYLDIQVRCPANLQPFEQVIRERIQSQLSRGKVSANISWNEEAQQKALPLTKNSSRLIWSNCSSWRNWATLK